MKFSTFVRVALAATVVTTSVVHAADNDVGRARDFNLGSPATTSMAMRTIDVHQKHFANVVHGDTVLFVDGAKSFAWRFDSNNRSVVELKRIAPPGFQADGYKVYIAPDPSELG